MHHRNLSSTSTLCEHDNTHMKRNRMKQQSKRPHGMGGDARARDGPQRVECVCSGCGVGQRFMSPTPSIFLGRAVVFDLVPTARLAKIVRGLAPILVPVWSSGVGGRGKIWIFRKCASFLGLFCRKFSHKSPNFLRSRLWCSRNSFFAVLCLTVHEKSDVQRTTGVHLEKLTFNSRLDNSR